MKFLWNPIKPWIVLQSFGGNSAYYAKFIDVNGNPEKGHMGVDAQATHGQPVYASHDGQATFIKDSHGGEGVYLKTLTAPYFTTIYWHLVGDTDPLYPNPIKMGVMTPVKVGDIIGYADNTGAPWESTGTHLHFGLAPCNEFGSFTEQGNGYGGCVNPEPYMFGYSAVDKGLVITLLQKMVSLLQQLSTFITS